MANLRQIRGRETVRRAARAREVREWWERAQSVSNRQYAVLLEAYNTGGLTLQRVLQLSQTTAGSVVRREYLEWTESVKRFTLTKRGDTLLAIYEGQSVDLERKNVERPLSKYIRQDGGKELGVHVRRIDQRLKARAQSAA